ncbi:MAG: hypothetical protein A4E27_01603 [Methanobacterium sp. PtaU1.Bin242]|nr:MAG: hypothetical protein A4E27_01603 [Methanobacterium sp. PtaU1.Bin242]
MNLLLSLIITCLAEFLILWLFIQHDPAKLLLYSLIINCLTLPLASYSYSFLMDNLLLIEIGVIIVEAVLLKYLLEIAYRKAFLISLIANGVTGALGFIL